MLHIVDPFGDICFNCSNKSNCGHYGDRWYDLEEACNIAYEREHYRSIKLVEISYKKLFDKFRGVS